MIMPENINSAFSKICYLSPKLEFGPTVRRLDTPDLENYKLIVKRKNILKALFWVKDIKKMKT